MAAGDTSGNPSASNASSTVGPSSQPIRTPMYAAMHAGRYQRQALIRAIQDRETGKAKKDSRLICYVSMNPLDRDDIVGFVDLLHVIPRGSNLDLLLHTPGGDIDAAEKLISMVRLTVDSGKLRVIVPDFAKSAGTLMALGADAIVMSDSSELGPIDPQIRIGDGRGNMLWHSVQSFLDAFEEHGAALRKDPNDPVARMMLTKLDPATLKQLEAVRARARTLAENHLKGGMFRTAAGNYTSIASDLIDTKRWLTHGQMIGHQAATQLGLNIEYLPQKSDEWQSYWGLYCLQRLEVLDRKKLFESEIVSFQMDGATS